MIDFEKLKNLDMEVINKNPSPEEDKAFSEFLKAHKAKQRRRTAAPASSMRTVPSRRKQAK